MSKNVSTTATLSNLSKLMRDRNLEDKAIAALEDCLDAQITMKNEEGKIVEFTDFRTILGAIQTILAYTAGKPVERREILTRKVTTLEDLKAQAKNSPELRSAIAELLDEKPIVQVPKNGAKSVSGSDSTV